MSTFRNLKIGAKISSGYLALVLLLIVVGVIGWQSISSLTSQYERLTENNLAGAVQLANAQNALWQLRFGIAQYLVLGSDERAKIVANEEVWYQRIAETMQEYGSGSRTAEEQAALKAFQEVYTKYIQSRPRWFQLQNEGKLEEAAEWRAQTTTVFGQGTVDALERLISLQHQVADEKHLEATDSATKAIWSMVGATGLALVVSLALAFFYGAEYRSPGSADHQDRPRDQRWQPSSHGTKGVGVGGKLAGQAGEVIHRIAAEVESGAQANMQIVAAAQQQTAGMVQIGQAMGAIQQATTQAMASTRQAERAAQDLHTLAQSLQQNIAVYRL